MRQLYRRRLNKTLTHPITQTCDQVKETGRVDVWLQRISYISQFGLFLITIATIYLTVIPLYQKALLDEAIAQQEIKLKELNETIENQYASFRKIVVKNYVKFAYLECMEINKGIKELQKMFNDSSVEIKGVTETSLENDLKIDIPSCLQQTLLELDQFHELRTEDQKVLQERIQAMSQEISNLKEQGLAEFNKINSLTEIEIEELPLDRIDYYQIELMKILDSNLSDEEQRKRINSIKIKRGRIRIVKTYFHNIYEKIKTLQVFD